MVRTDSGDARRRDGRLCARAPAGARYVTREKQRELLYNLIRFEVLAAEAERLGYERDPEVVRVMKQQDAFVSGLWRQSRIEVLEDNLGKRGATARPPSSRSRTSAAGWPRAAKTRC